MIKKYFVLLLTAVVLSFSSCVSKKKYLEMEAGRLKAEELSRKLDSENNAKADRIKALIADFEAMKNELMESNALKDEYINDLKKELSDLNADLNKQTQSLEETSFNLDFEKQRLTDALKSKDKTIQSMQVKVNDLEEQISTKNMAIDEKNFEIGKLNEQAKVLEGKIAEGESKFSGLQEKLDKAKSDMSKVQDEMKEKDTLITKLQNQVKLLKSQIGQ